MPRGHQTAKVCVHANKKQEKNKVERHKKTAISKTISHEIKLQHK